MAKVTIQTSCIKLKKHTWHLLAISLTTWRIDYSTCSGRRHTALLIIILGIIKEKNNIYIKLLRLIRDSDDTCIYGLINNPSKVEKKLNLNKYNAALNHVKTRPTRIASSKYPSLQRDLTGRFSLLFSLQCRCQFPIKEERLNYHKLESQGIYKNNNVYYKQSDLNIDFRRKLSQKLNLN